MKKNLLTLAALCFGAASVFAFPGGIHSTEPAEQATFSFNDWTWTNVQRGADIKFKGWVEEWENVDSIAFRVTCLNSGWAPRWTWDSIAVGADVFSDSTYEAIIHLNDTVPTKLAGDVGYLFQTRVWYDTTAAVFMTDSGWSNIGAVRHGDNNSFWLNFTFTPVDAYADQPTITNLTNGQHMGEYEPGDEVVLNGNKGYYGILDNPQYVQQNLMNLSSDWMNVRRQSDTYPVAGDAQKVGFFRPNNIVIPADWTTDADQTNGDFTIFRLWVPSDNSDGDVQNNIFYLNLDIVAVKKDSIVLSAETDLGEWSRENNTIATTLTVYPANATVQSVIYTLSDSSVASVDAAGVVTFVDPVEVGDDVTVTVDVTATSTNMPTMSRTLTLTATNITNGIEDAMVSNVRVYPNPATSQLHITGVENASISIFNLLGAEVMNTKLEGSVVSVSELPAGTYILNIRSNDQTVVRKISIQ